MGPLRLGSNNINMFVLALLFLPQHFLTFSMKKQNILLLLLSSDIVNMFHTDVRFRYRGKILLEVRKHKLLGHIYKQRTYARAHKLIPVSALLMI